MFLCRNIVSTVNLCCKLDLKKIALHARNAEYNPKRFAAVIMRIREPRTTALIFSSGKMVCTGAKSEDDSRLAARKYARIIQKLGFPVSSRKQLYCVSIFNRKIVIWFFCYTYMVLQSWPMFLTNSIFPFNSLQKWKAKNTLPLSI